ncbi:MAG TPA: sn-glycerol-3-phosphate ABC transporter substrate-binding protein UgpB [Acetobacteraceae bacterium]|jgi:sn-glycerol 3-phosphate transport system substrate-binding protein|nr:sn-glycerol-3-phosphate ABC transporter substrate-binding protein UgpB [Acetobacteraceae bacterium]
MKRRTLLAGTAALAAAPAIGRAAEKTKIVWWHAMTAALGEQVNHIAETFNASQDAVELQAIYKGGYADVLTATIAASRAGQAPHLVQIFEVGTGTMLAAGKAVKQTWELAQDTGATIDPNTYIASVRGYYSLPDGRMASMPFNSSTAVMWYSKDAFRKAGLDPDKPPATWPEVIQAAQAIKAKDAAEIPMTSSWLSWIQLEQYSALHDIPFASKADGFEGLDAQLEISSKPHVKHMERLLEMAKDGTFKYTGRDNQPDQLLVSGKAGIHFNSSGMRGDLVKSAKFDWGEAYLPYDPDLIKSPLNSIIGGASLWTMTAPGRTPAEYKAVATFLQFIGKPDNDAYWHQHTGYVPVTLAGFELSDKQGFYAKNPGADLPVRQLTRGTVTNNSKGLRLGRLVEIRNIIYEEMEKAFQGGQTAQQAMDSATARGNKVLRDFEKSVKT